MRFLSASRIFTRAIKCFFQLVQFSFLFKNPFIFKNPFARALCRCGKSFEFGPLLCADERIEKRRNQPQLSKVMAKNGENLFKFVFTRYASSEACVVHDIVKITIAKK